MSSFMVIRGGSWIDVYGNCGSASRGSWYVPGNRYECIGFRVARAERGMIMPAKYVFVVPRDRGAWDIDGEDCGSEFRDRCDPG
jgi:hypothetical protein